MVVFSKLTKFAYITGSRKEIVFTAAGIFVLLIFKFIKLARIHGFQATALHFIFFFTGRSKLREKLAVADSFHVDIITTSSRDSRNGKVVDFVNLKKDINTSLAHLKLDFGKPQTDDGETSHTVKPEEFNVEDLKDLIAKEQDGVVSIASLKQGLNVVRADLATFTEYIRSFPELEFLGEESSTNEVYVKIRAEVESTTCGTPMKLSSEFSHDDIIDAILEEDGYEISVEKLRIKLGFMFMSSLMIKLKEIPELELWEKTLHNYCVRFRPAKALLSFLEQDPNYQRPLSNINIRTPHNTDLAKWLENQSQFEVINQDGVKWVRRNIPRKKPKIAKEGVWLGSPEFFEIESDEELSWGSSASSSVPPCQMTVRFSTKQRANSIKREKQKNRKQARRRSQSTRRRKTARRVRYV